MHAHSVVVSKHRQQVFGSCHLERKQAIMPDVRADLGCQLAEF